jgi:hypothetical protein
MNPSIDTSLISLISAYGRILRSTSILMAFDTFTMLRLSKNTGGAWMKSKPLSIISTIFNAQQGAL